MSRKVFFFCYGTKNLIIEHTTFAPMLLNMGANVMKVQKSTKSCAINTSFLWGVVIR